MRVAALLALVLLALPGTQASHDDGWYDLPVWFEWEKAELDVLIVPPNHGQLYNGNGALNGGDPFEATPLNSYLAATLDSIAGWREAMDRFGPAWMAGVTLRVHVLGVDGAPEETMAEPEIVIVYDETKLYILGVAVNTRPCLVDNSRMLSRSFTYEDMYNINGQEFGHCLGLGHVQNGHPDHDVMDGGYGHTPGAAGTHLHCVSNLDIAALAKVFGPLFGDEPGPGGRVAVADYATWPCG